MSRGRSHALPMWVTSLGRPQSHRDGLTHTPPFRGAQQLGPLACPAGDRGVTKHGVNEEHDRDQSVRRGGWKATSCCWTLDVDPQPVPATLNSHSMFCKRSHVAHLTTSQGWSTYNIGMACWFPLIQLCFSVERPGSTQSRAMHVLCTHSLASVASYFDLACSSWIGG